MMFKLLVLLLFILGTRSDNAGYITINFDSSTHHKGSELCMFMESEAENEHHHSSGDDEHDHDGLLTNDRDEGDIRVMIVFGGTHNILK